MLAHRLSRLLLANATNGELAHAVEGEHLLVSRREELGGSVVATAQEPALRGPGQLEAEWLIGVWQR